MTKGELKDIIRECYYELLAEDKSDIARQYAEDRYHQKERSVNGYKKNPSSMKYIDNEERKNYQREYDHGNRSTRSEMADRYAKAGINYLGHTTGDKKISDSINDLHSQLYDKAKLK